MKLIVEGMTCSQARHIVTTAIQSIDATASVDIEPDAEEVSIVGNIDVADAVKAIQDEGYVVVSILPASPAGSGCCGTCGT